MTPQTAVYADGLTKSFGRTRAVTSVPDDVHRACSARHTPHRRSTGSGPATALPALWAA